MNTAIVGRVRGFRGYLSLLMYLKIAWRAAFVGALSGALMLGFKWWEIHYVPEGIQRHDALLVERLTAPADLSKLDQKALQQRITLLNSRVQSLQKEIEEGPKYKARADQLEKLLVNIRSMLEG